MLEVISDLLRLLVQQQISFEIYFIEGDMFLNNFFKSLLLLVSFLIAGTVIASPWPDKPIKIIVPYPPGGGVDAVARTYAQRLGEVLNTNIIV